MSTETTIEANLDLLHQIFREKWHGDMIRPAPKLAPKDKKMLRNHFQTCAGGRSKLEKYMKALATELHLPVGTAYEIGEMKDYNRAAEKIGVEGRAIDDLGRGRVFFRTQKQAENFLKIFEKFGRNTHQFHKDQKTKGVEFNGKINNYLKYPRSSGYSGSINFKVKVPCTGQRSGKLEIQFMPFNMQETYDQSHIFFGLIRDIEEQNPEKSRTSEQQERLDVLIFANKSLWDQAFLDEHLEGLREGSIETPDPRIVAFAKDPETALTSERRNRKRVTFPEKEQQVSLGHQAPVLA